MDDAFRMVAARMPRTRRLTPFAARATAMLVVLGVLLVVFASFVTSEQRAADARRAQLEATQRADAEAEARAAAAQIGAAGPGITPNDATVRGMVNERAQGAAATALDTAQRFAATGSLDGATAIALSPLELSLVFVDGPSTGPSVVSVYAGAAGWAAAVGGARGSCYWVAVAPDGRTRYGTGAPCTGMAALAADRNAW
jgi:hypothetical protein